MPRTCAGWPAVSGRGGAVASRSGCRTAWGIWWGTCRMDRSDWQGVADRQGQVRGFANLYLAGAGLIPAPVAVNPTLTAVALALGTCYAIAARLLSGG